MESYNMFLERIGSFELPVMSLGDGDFSANPSVMKKVGADHSFLPFYGDTIVFDLSEAEKKQLELIIKLIYEIVPEVFCEPLLGSTLHMTLHDLSNAPEQAAISGQMQKNQAKLREILAASPVPQKTIPMESKAVFNMVGTSLVMGLIPSEETGYRQLMELYALCDLVQTLPYPLTPHITLAYYRREGFSQCSAEMLCALVGRLNRQTYRFTLDTNRLYYQHFTSMNAYRNVLCLADGKEETP